MRGIRLASYLLLMFYASGCSAVMINSHWADARVIIDGKNNEWDDVKEYLLSKKVAVGAFNDDKYLYLYLITWDQQLGARLRNEGPLVEFYRSGNKKRSLGLHACWNTVEIFSNSTMITREPLEALRSKGIEITAGREEQNTIYEMKVPLKRTADVPYAIDIVDDDRIKVIFDIEGILCPAAACIKKDEDFPGRPGNGMPPPGEPTAGGAPGNKPPLENNRFLLKLQILLSRLKP